MTLKEKLEVLEELESGKSAAEVGRRHDANESTIRSIRKIGDKIRASVRSSTNVSSKVSCVSRRDPVLEKMEAALALWMDVQTRTKHSDVGYSAVRAKALSLYEKLQQEEEAQPGTSASSTESATPFSASKGWFDRFKRRQALHGIHRHGEMGSADTEAAEHFKTTFAKYIADEGYVPEQVFNADETGLFYKKVGRKTYVSKEVKKLPGFKLAKDRITLLFSGNAAGDFHCKPLMLYRSENPRALKGKNKASLPVHWRSNKKAWMTASLFEDWFQHCFVREVETYLARKNLHFKAVLLLDNAPGHSTRNVNFDHPAVKVMFLPPNTTSLLQPMDRGVIRSFKAHYTRLVYDRAIKTLDASENLTMMDFWKSYNIRDGIEVVKGAWDCVTPSTLNACWNQLWPEVVHEFRGFSIEPAVKQIVNLAHKIGGEGFTDMTEDDVYELLDSHDQDPTDDELISMAEEQNVMAGDDDDEDDDGDAEEATPQPLNLRNLGELFRKAEDFSSWVVEIDPLLERSAKFRRNLEACLAPYRAEQRHLEMTARQTSITQFFRVGASSHQPSTAATSTSSLDPLSPPVIHTQEKVEHEEEKEDSDDSITY